MFDHKSTQHCEDVGMTRWQHFTHAIGIAFQLMFAAFAVILHAFLPRYFQTYATDKCKKILDNRPK